MRSMPGSCHMRARYFVFVSLCFDGAAVSACGGEGTTRDARTQGGNAGATSHGNGGGGSTTSSAGMGGGVIITNGGRPQNDCTSANPPPDCPTANPGCGDGKTNLAGEE